MVCIGEFIYKGVEKREGGTFTNDKGQNINYDASYLLKVDELTDSGAYERKLKISKDNTMLVDKLKAKKFYEKINLRCEIVFSNSNVRVIPVDLVDSNNK